MKKADVQIGEVYAVKVSGKAAPVVIDEVCPDGGWFGTNEETHRRVTIKDAQRLRCLWSDYLARGEKAFGEDEPDAPGGDTGAKGEKKAEREPKDAKAKKKATGAKTGAQGEEEGKRKPKDAKAKKKATEAKTGAQKRGLSGLDAAAKVLEEAGEALSCKAIVERAFAAGYWQSDGKTPHATVYSAILREIQKKGDAARFRKTERGRFALAK